MSRRRRGAGLLGAIAAIVLTAFVGTALADNFQGSTSDGSYARVKTNERNVPELLAIRWHARCDERGVFYHARNAFGGPFRSQSRNHFRDWSRTRNNNLEDNFTSVVTTQYRGFRAARNRWSGTFRAWVIVKKGGQFFTRCRTGLISWTTVRD